MNRQNFKYDQRNDSMFANDEYRKKYRDTDPVMHAENYFSNYNLIEKRQR